MKLLKFQKQINVFGLREGESGGANGKILKYVFEKIISTCIFHSD